MPDLPDVRPGQVWADNDWRQAGRTLRVVDLVHDSLRGGELTAVLEVLTDRSPTRNYPAGLSQVGKRVRVRVRRMRPTSTGFRLLTEAP